MQLHIEQYSYPFQSRKGTKPSKIINICDKVAQTEERKIINHTITVK
jgi:hypothetical protein